MTYPKLFAIRPGDALVTYAGFDCVAAGTTVLVEIDDAGMFFRCRDGHHYLESQRDADGRCLGLTPALLA